jgi:tetratricopeptide (TPR) repeat protein
MSAALRKLVAAGALVLTAAPGYAADAGPFAGAQYRACAAKSRQAPEAAFEDALAWHGAGGGLAADHCAALALLALKEPARAAQRLDRVARNPRAGAPTVRATIFGEAGNAWLLARRGPEAEAAFSEALKLAPRDADLWIDRARARALTRNWRGAEADLSAALKLGVRADIYLLRSTARRALNRLPAARADIDSALFLSPRYAEALVERGSMKLIAGDKQGARRDWLQVLLIAPNGPAGDEARRRIEDLEINPNR